MVGMPVEGEKKKYEKIRGKDIVVRNAPSNAVMVRTPI